MRRAPARVIAAIIVAYQWSFGRLFGGNCRFHPSCSQYALEAVRLNGALFGGCQALWRLVRCGPWSRGGVDRPRPRSRVKDTVHG